MGDSPQKSPQIGASKEASRLISVHSALIDRLYRESGAGRWDLPLANFRASLERAVSKRLTVTSLDSQQLEEFLSTLHLEDLALACACQHGNREAWESLFERYQPHLRGFAGSLLGRPPDAPESRELADSLFGELYGLSDGRQGEQSLFRYFHGRSSLKTWLRAVLAQRHVDQLRAGKRLDPLEPENGGARHEIPGTIRVEAPDPRRGEYLMLFEGALTAALAKLASRDRERLILYYVDDRTLAQIGRTLGEHESSVSRNLDRIRKEVRLAVEEALRHARIDTDALGSKIGLSEAEISLCFEYAAEDVPIDLGKMFKSPGAPARKEREA